MLIRHAPPKNLGHPISITAHQPNLGPLDHALIPSCHAPKSHTRREGGMTPCAPPKETRRDTCRSETHARQLISKYKATDSNDTTYQPNKQMQHPQSTQIPTHAGEKQSPQYGENLAIQFPNKNTNINNPHIKQKRDKPAGVLRTIHTPLQSRKPPNSSLRNLNQQV